jgi:four helix bundle protein
VTFKFEKLEVYQLALDYIDLIYGIARQLPKAEEFNLKSQLVRAAMSVALNIAEGSTGQTDAEQARFLGMAMRSLLETVACQQIIHRQGFLQDEQVLSRAASQAETLAIKLQAMRKTVLSGQQRVHEEDVEYIVGDE